MILSNILRHGVEKIIKQTKVSLTEIFSKNMFFKFETIFFNDKNKKFKIFNISLLLYLIKNKQGRYSQVYLNILIYNFKYFFVLCFAWLTTFWCNYEAI